MAEKLDKMGRNVTEKTERRDGIKSEKGEVDSSGVR